MDRAPIAIRCGSAERFISTRTAPAYSISIATTLHPSRSSRSRTTGIGTCAGPAPMPGPDHLRIGRRIAYLRYARQPGPGAVDLVPADITTRRPQPVNAADNIESTRHQPGRRARCGGGARRRVFRAGGIWRHAQPDAFLECPRSRSGLVARRQATGLRVGSQRRRGDLSAGPGRQQPRRRPDPGFIGALPGAALVGRR